MADHKLDDMLSSFLTALISDHVLMLYTGTPCTPTPDHSELGNSLELECRFCQSLVGYMGESSSPPSLLLGSIGALTHCSLQRIVGISVL